jgi:hypothetical protein
MKIYNNENEQEIIRQIIWQYENAPALKSLLESKQDWYNTNQYGFWQQFFNDVVNTVTATDFGLSWWGAFLNVQRKYEMPDGSVVTLDTETYRILVRSRLLMIRMRGDIPSINRYLKVLFINRGTAFCFDNHDMTLNYVLNFPVSEIEKVLISDLELGILPQLAGVGFKAVYIITAYPCFGFYGSTLAPFNQRPFFDGLIIENQ